MAGRTWVVGGIAASTGAHEMAYRVRSISGILFATQPITGHVLPALPMVRALAKRGHDVRWYTGRSFREKVETAGAEFVPYEQARDYDDADFDAAFPGRSKLKGLRQIRFDLLNLFAKQIEGQHRDLGSALERRPADVTVGAGSADVEGPG